MCLKKAGDLSQEFSENTKTEAIHKEMESFFDEFFEQEKRQREIVKTTEYIKWLENFTKKHPSFSDDTWLYKRDEISEEDYKNVCKISTFFCGIEIFAKENYIAGTPCDWGKFYSIEYNGKVYEIGTIVGQGAVSFCNTQDINEEASVIKFEEIANPSEELRIRTALIENQLQRINDLFSILVNNKKLNIPIEVIAERASQVLDKLK